MKEYIEKKAEEMASTFFKVIKSDICREFANRLKECAVEVDGYNESSYMVEVSSIDEILAEMENDND